MKRWYTVTFNAKLDGEDVCDMKNAFYLMMAQEMLIQECTNLQIKAEDPNTQEMKRWYVVSFGAKMDEDDLRAMQSCFYLAMEKTLFIKECTELQIKTI